MADIVVGQLGRVDAGRAAKAVGLAILAVALLALVAAPLESVQMLNEPFDVRGSRMTIPAVVAGSLLTVSALAALSLAGIAGATDAAWRWRLLAGTLLLAGLEAGLALSVGIGDWLGTDGHRLARGAFAAGLAVVSAVAIAGVEPRRTRQLMGAGLATWLLGQGVDAALPAALAPRLLAETLAMGGGAAIMLGLLVGIHELLPGEARTGYGDGWRSTVVSFACSCDLRRVAWMVGGVVATVTGVGTVVHLADIPLPSIGLLGEFTLSSYVNSGLLLAVAVISLAMPAADSRQRRAFHGLALLFAVLAGGELLEIHEKLDHYLGVPGQVGYAPFLIAGAVGAAAVLDAVRWRSEVRNLLLGGAALWFFAQSIDVWSVIDQLTASDRSLDDGISPFFMDLIPIEEGAEMCGTALIGIGLLAAIRQLSER